MFIFCIQSQLALKSDCVKCLLSSNEYEVIGSGSIIIGKAHKVEQNKKSINTINNVVFCVHVSFGKHGSHRCSVSCNWTWDNQTNSYWHIGCQRTTLAWLNFEYTTPIHHPNI